MYGLFSGMQDLEHGEECWKAWEGSQGGWCVFSIPGIELGVICLGQVMLDFGFAGVQA